MSLNLAVEAPTPAAPAQACFLEWSEILSYPAAPRPALRAGDRYEKGAQTLRPCRRVGMMKCAHMRQIAETSQ